MLRMMEPQAWGVHGSQILVSAGHGMLQACWEVKKSMYRITVHCVKRQGS